MPDADLQRILTDLLRKREELARVIFKSDAAEKPAGEKPSAEPAVDRDATVPGRVAPGSESP